MVVVAFAQICSLLCVECSGSLCSSCLTDVEYYTLHLRGYSGSILQTRGEIHGRYRNWWNELARPTVPCSVALWGAVLRFVIALRYHSFSESL